MPGMSKTFLPPLIVTAILVPLLKFDLLKFGQRSLKFAGRRATCIENFAEACRCFCPVGLPKGEDAVVAQKPMIVGSEIL